MKSSIVWKSILGFSLSCIFYQWPIFSQEEIPSLVKNIQSGIVMIRTFDKNGNALLQATGFFVDGKGDVVSNRHVFEDAVKATIKTADNEIFPVKQLLSKDDEGDLVMVSVDIPEKSVLPLKVENIAPAVGEKILVIGNPLGLEQTVSDGIVSAVRAIPAFGDIIQITAPISSGSSGSPVVNLKGNVVGVATFFVNAGQNLNFAIPGKRVVELMIDTIEKKPGEWTIELAEDTIATTAELCMKGIRYILTEEYENAITCFKQVLNIYPNDAKSYLEIGFCMVQLAQKKDKDSLVFNPEKSLSEIQIDLYDEAIASYKKALFYKPDNFDAYYWLGYVYNCLKKYQKAIENYEQALRIKPDYTLTNKYTIHRKYSKYEGLGLVSNFDPNYYTVYLRVAECYRDINLDQKAVAAYKQAIRIKPDDIQAYVFLGSVYEDLNKYTEAVGVYKELIKINPDKGTGYSSLGTLYRELKMYNEAIEAFKQAIRINPDVYNYHYMLGDIYQDLKRYQEASEEFKLAIHIIPCSDARIKLGDVYRKLNMYQEAVEVYEQVIQVEADNAEAHFNLGMAYIAIGERGLAIDEYKILKNIDKSLANKLFSKIYK